MLHFEGKLSQVQERLDAMSQTFEHLSDDPERIYTNYCRPKVAPGHYLLNEIHDAVGNPQAPQPGPATTSQRTTPTAAAASISDDSSSLHTLDFAAQQEEIVTAAVKDPNAAVEPPAAILDAGIVFDSPFDGVGDDEFVPKDEPETHQVEVDFARDSSPVERKAVPSPPPPLPTPAASSPMYRREIPPRKTRSQTATGRGSSSATPRGRSKRSAHNRLSAMPSVSSPLAGSSGSRFTSTLSPSPGPPVRLDLHNPDPRAVKVQEGLVAISAGFRGDDEKNFEEFEVPDELLAAPDPVSATPVPGRVKQPHVPAKRGRKRIKRERDDSEGATVQTTVLWPALIIDTEHVSTVGCDRCGVWYHYGCVGFAADVVLAEDQRFECPPCLAEIRLGKDIDPERALQAKRRVQHCGRSDCKLRMDVDEYFVERIIGRRPSADEEGGLEYYIKWDGYELDEATWQPPDTLPSQVGQRLIREFERQATIEGIDVADKDEAIVLNDVHLYKARSLQKRKADEIS